MTTSRRDFIRAASLGGASLLTASPLFGTANLKNHGIALVGLGQYAMGELAPALQQTKHCHLAGLVSGTPKKRAHYGSKYQIPKENIYDYERYDSISDNKDIDIVYVVLPNSMHADYSIRAAEAGKHVITEKPMGISVSECDRMIDACKSNGVTLNVGYRLHFEPHHQVVAHLGKEHTLGAPLYLRAECCQVMDDPQQWRLRKALAGGGAVYDIGIYCIQVARYAMNAEPIAITAQEFKTDPVKFAEVDETVTFQLEFDSGVVANCTCSYNAHGHKLYIAYSKNNDYLEVENAFYYRDLSGSINGRPMDNILPVNQQALQMDAIAQSIVTGNNTGISGAEGRQDMVIIEALYRSLESGNQRIKI
ncbi:MAG TPA: glucose-fructose oxidoreductase [Opitutae bacterium]|nr:glucose-fructose oxidoreductase [Opitutae bacterium]